LLFAVLLVVELAVSAIAVVGIIWLFDLWSGDER
jgi:hypothetical protein